MSLARRDLLLALAGAAAPGQSRGAVAFHYEAIFAPDAVDWYTRFQMLVTGAVLAPEESAKLRGRASRLIAYEWSSGFYTGDTASVAPGWESACRKNARSWLLSVDTAGGGAAAPGRSAFWYDFGDPGLVAARSDYLAGLLRSSGYDGLFFDTPGFEQLPEPMRAAFKTRHPGADYNQCQGAFFGALRERIGPGRTIFLNQGYRHAEHMLPHADLDLTESYFTALDGNTTKFRKWHDPAAPWESIRTPMAQLVVPAARKFPHVRFVHVNYAGGGAALARRAARYSWACAKLWGHDSYLIAPGAYADEREEIYFTATGAPKTERYREAGDIAWRVFDKGIVAVNGGAGPGRIPDSGLALPEAGQGYFFAQ
jgi:hypothetical protein